MSIHRRRVLKALGASSVTAVAGCFSRAGLGSRSGTNTSTETDHDEKDAQPILTGYTVSEYTVRPTVEHTSDMDAWGVFIGTESIAADYFSDADGADVGKVEAFIEETDFEAGDRLLYVEAYAPQTCYELILTDDPEVAANGLPAVAMTVNRTEPDDQPCGDAMTPVDSLIRLSFDIENGSPTDVIEVAVSGYKDEAEKLLIEIDR